MNPAPGSGGAARPQRVWAVLVSYRPELALLDAALRAVAPQVAGLLIVDNGSAPELVAELRELAARARAGLIELGANRGVAAAQNRGIEHAQRCGADAVLLLDQDSVPAVDMVARLGDAIEQLAASGRTRVVVGPRLLDRRSGQSAPFVRYRALRVQRQPCRDGAVLQTDFLISSGTLVPMAVLAEVGLPDETLFIDNVDLDWSFRARACGVTLYGVCAAVLEHSVGEQVLRCCGLTLYRHGPVRQYYIMRNRIALYRRRYAPRAWIAQDMLRVGVKLLVLLLLFPGRRQNLAMMWRGFVDGLRGRGGPLR